MYFFKPYFKLLLFTTAKNMVMTRSSVGDHLHFSERKHELKLPDNCSLCMQIILLK